MSLRANRLKKRRGGRKQLPQCRKMFQPVPIDCATTKAKERGYFLQGQEVAGECSLQLPEEEETEGSAEELKRAVCKGKVFVA